MTPADLIGRTPTVQISRLVDNPRVRLFVKLEGLNIGGSVKDRPALFMLDDAIETGRLRKGMTVLEASSGNTGIAVSMLAHVRGFPAHIVMPAWVTQERQKLVAAWGGSIEYTSGPTTKESLERAKLLAERDARFCLLNQYENPANPRAHYETTGPEIIQAIPEVDVLVAGLGSGGTLMGTGTRLKEHNRQIRVVAVEPHPDWKIEGIQNFEDAAFLPPLLDYSVLDGRRIVDGNQALEALRAAKREGLLLGPSAGAILFAAVQEARRLGSGTIVAIMPDAAWKYLSLDLFNDDLSPEEARRLLPISW